MGANDPAFVSLVIIAKSVIFCRRTRDRRASTAVALCGATWPATSHLGSSVKGLVVQSDLEFLDAGGFAGIFRVPPRRSHPSCYIYPFGLGEAWC